APARRPGPRGGAPSAGPGSRRAHAGRVLRSVRFGAAARIMLANSLMLIGIVLLTTTLLYIQISNAATRTEQDVLRASAEVMAGSRAIEDRDPDRIAALLENIKREYRLDEIEVLDADEVQPGVREGRTETSYRGGPEGGMMYATAPIRRGDEVVGGVRAGVHGDDVRSLFAPQGAWIVGVGAVTLVLGVTATWLTSRGLRRATGDYGTAELGNMIGYYQSVLQSVSEGLLLFDRTRGEALYNREAAELLGLPEQRTLHTVPLQDLLDALPAELRGLLSSGAYARDEFRYTDERVLVVNQQPAEGAGDTWVTTMRDHTELQELSGELVSLQSFSESLRSQTHEFANRMHIIASLIETGQAREALEFATREMTLMDRPSANMLAGFDDPVVSALLLTKLTQAHEAGIELRVDAERLSGVLRGAERDLVTVVGNLLDNAFDAVSRPGIEPARRRVWLSVSGSDAQGFEIAVADDGPGIAEEDIDRVFERGWSTKHRGVGADCGEGHARAASRGVGLSIVVQAVRRLGGAIDVRGGPDEPGDPRGAAFIVWLPGAGHGESATAPPRRTEEPGG
ncbi:sensor histidine kinase, partial [Brevibacterium rongguiense]|uniref:sensor histidine kinase n=1 Tax=Brevibacterium rongguiense TaxID=2695267 RepID=UPI001F15BB57